MDGWQMIYFTIWMTGYFFYEILKPYDPMDKVFGSLRDYGLIPRVVTYDLANKNIHFSFNFFVQSIFNRYLYI